MKLLNGIMRIEQNFHVVIYLYLNRFNKWLNITLSNDHKSKPKRKLIHNPEKHPTIWIEVPFHMVDNNCNVP